MIYLYSIRNPHRTISQPLQIKRTMHTPLRRGTAPDMKHTVRLLCSLFVACVVAPFLQPTYCLPGTDPKPSPENDTLRQHELETEILLLRRKELDTEARIERLKIDIQALEKRWQNARESDTESRLLFDSSSTSQLKTKVLWEQLTSWRTDLENTQLLLDTYRRQGALLRSMARTFSAPADMFDIWHRVIDSAGALRTSLDAERQWRAERLAESRFEAAALDRMLDSATLPADDRRMLRKRKTFIANTIASDSLVSSFITSLDTSLTRSTGEAYAALERITPRQKQELLYRRIRGVWNFAIYSVGDKPLTIGKIITALLIIIIGLKIAESVSRLIASAIKHRSKLDEGVVDAGQKLFFYTFTALFTLYALYLAQVPLTAFTVMGGALALGLGFGSQNILKNFISGIILLLERPMKTHDFLEIDGAIGTVESIGLRSTRIRTPDNVHMVLPNSSFLEKNVINWTLADRLVRLTVQVGVQYGSPVHEVKRLLLEAAAIVPDVLKQPVPEVLFADFGDNALAFELYFWIRIKNIIDRRRVLSALRFAINDSFTSAGIVIAFPQRDVHFDRDAPLQVQVLPAEAGTLNATVRPRRNEKRSEK